MIPSSDTLAHEFSKGLRSYLTSEQMDEIVQRNSVEADARICHSHDFCDANMFLYDAFMKFGIDPSDVGGIDRWGDLWNSAWNEAKSNDFNTDRQTMENVRPKPIDESGSSPS